MMLTRIALQTSAMIASIVAISPTAMSQAEFNGRIEFGGTIEVEASYADHDIDGSSSDLVVATVALELAAEIAPNVNAFIATLYEEDDTDLEIDVATLTIDQLLNSPLSLTLGQDYLPFGRYETALVNDTLALELGETRETMGMLTFSQSGLSLSAFVFNGDHDSGNQSTLENFGLSLGFENDNVAIGADYLGNILESDAELVESPVDDDAVAGYAVHGALHFAPFHLNAEYLKSDEISDLGDAEIEATQLEASFDLGNWTLATAYQTTDDAEGFLPETRISLGASTELMENVGLGIEIWRDEDYDDSEADNLVLQIAASF